MKQYVLFFSVIVMFLSLEPLWGQKNLLKDFGYSPTHPGWETWASKKLKITSSKSNSNEQGFHIRFERGKLLLHIPAMSHSKVWFVQVRQRIELTPGKKYQLQVKLKAEKAGIMAMLYELDCPPWKTFGLNKRIKVSPGEKIYTAEFTVHKNNTGKPVAVKLCFGMLPGNITASEAKLKLIE